MEITGFCVVDNRKCLIVGALDDKISCNISQVSIQVHKRRGLLRAIVNHMTEVLLPAVAVGNVDVPLCFESSYFKSGVAIPGRVRNKSQWPLQVNIPGPGFKRSICYRRTVKHRAVLHRQPSKDLKIPFFN